jgi:N-acetylneuraminic acid mutarotase
LPGAGRILSVAGANESGEFYLFGGAALVAGDDGKVRRQYLRETWRWRGKDGWHRLADLPHPIVGAASPAPWRYGKFFVIAGDDGSRVGFQPTESLSGFPGSVLAYDPAQDRWLEAGTTPAPRATLPCVSWRGGFVLPSGEMRPGVRSPEVWTLGGEK